MAVKMHETEVILCPWFSLLGSSPVPLHRFGITLRYTLPFVIHQPQIILGPGFAALGEKLYFAKGLVVIAAQIGLVGAAILAGCEGEGDER